MSGGARLLVPYVRREWRALATVGVTTAVAAAAEDWPERVGAMLDAAEAMA